MSARGANAVLQLILPDVIHLSGPTVPDPEAQPATTKGRSGSETRRMGWRIAVRMTDGELAQATAAAKSAGVSVEDYLRDAALSEPATRGSGDHVTRRAQMKFLRVTEAQRQRIQELADRAGLSTGSYIRARGLQHPVTLTTRRPPVEKAELARLLGLLGRVYQQVRGEAAGADVPAVDATEALAAVQAAAAEIVRSLGREPKARTAR